MEPTSLSLSTMAAPFIGIAAKYIVNYLKSAPWFSLLSKYDGRLKKHLVVLFVVTILSLIVAFFTGSLDEGMVNAALALLVNVISGQGAAVATHEITKEAPATVRELTNEGP